MAEEKQNQEQETQEVKEPETEPKQEQNTEPEDDEAKVSQEEQIRQLMAENAKLKRDKDTASADAAKWKKQYNATLTDAQRAAQDKADRDAALEAEVQELRKKDKVNDLTASLLELGYSKDKAKEAATAQYDGDWDTYNRLQQEHQKEVLAKAEQDWLKSRPEVKTGAGDMEEEDAFLKGFNSVKTLGSKG